MPVSHARQPDERVIALTKRYVSTGSGSVRRYLQLGGYFLTLPAYRLRWFAWRLARDARRISDADLEILLSWEWRSRLTAAWLIGLDRRTQFREHLGELLVASDLLHAGSAYCFALARFGEERDAEILTEYLSRWLPEHECQYDQYDAMGALLYLDELRGTEQAQRLLGAGGLWESWAGADADPAGALEDMRLLCAFAEASMSGRLGPWLQKRPEYVIKF